MSGQVLTDKTGTLTSSDKTVQCVALAGHDGCWQMYTLGELALLVDGRRLRLDVAPDAFTSHRRDEYIASIAELMCVPRHSVALAERTEPSDGAVTVTQAVLGAPPDALTRLRTWAATSALAELGYRVAIEEAERVFFFDILEHADGKRRGACADLKVPQCAPHRDLSDATLGDPS